MGKTSFKNLQNCLKCGYGLVVLAMIFVVLYEYSLYKEEMRKNIIWRLQNDSQVNCSRIIEGNRTEIAKVRRQMKFFVEIDDNPLLEKTKSCTWLEQYFNNSFYVTNIEKSFPIAFAFLIYNSPHQVLRLLKFLYRPHNQYCIAPDLKSGSAFIDIFRNIARCLDNVFIVSKLRKVKWGHKSIMETQMQCYSDLLELRQKQAESRQWKYVINLCGKELPLNTNHEIVTKLVRLEGTSAIKVLTLGPNVADWARLRDQSIPHSIPFYKSMTYMALSYVFINFLFTNSTAIELYNFFRTCRMPEEHYYATVYMIPNVPGGYHHSYKDYIFEVDSYFWRTKTHLATHPKQCSGFIVHNICIVNFGDLHRILQVTRNGKKAIFHNKYFLENDHVIMDCMEEWIMDKNKKEYHNEITHLKNSGDKYNLDHG